MFEYLRGFTRKFETCEENKLLTALNDYFDVVVQAIEANEGDVQKFMGDAILSIFPIGTLNSRSDQCRNVIGATRAALAAMAVLNKKRDEGGEEALPMGIGINRGSVTYGNIGSPGRLDFTVLGSAVNVASRVQDLCKTVGETLLATQSVALCWPDAFCSKGSHSVRGLAEPIQVFALT